ncbi:4-sulfomuconolactone hydrolase [Penicillium ucsense]|uniref:4-sulfomuconolactone hydrolase n=1 Tax=Penicillium ucsense TaxID=2839758 RepID=A0A8J8W1J1_9EURO|nr:4-sulfomuconolactone hydrolase [Penicillium ucsense]KAF7734019.1 4-sulfomuconolactone hydrolase [Penicillium ucsense]
MWDTHVHCFDPERYPFKPTRTYTPPPAPLEELITQTKATRLVLVQASIEDGHSGLVDNLSRVRREYPHLLARGIICLDQSWATLSDQDIDTLHHLGVRYVRIHGFLGDSMSDPTRLEQQIRQFCRSYAVQRWNWGLSAQLSLATWALLTPLIVHDPEFSRLRIIVDHVGCCTPEDWGTPQFSALLQLLQTGRVHVKVSCLYRRSPDNVQNMKPIIQSLADNAPSALLWGSDWPHVESTKKSVDSSVPSEPVDIEKELELLHSWMSTDQWQKMRCENPEKLFAY